MDTTKLIVEYLIIGVLVVLSLIFLAFSIAPQEFAPILNLLDPNASIIGTTAFIVILLPIAYAVGIVAEYLGMILYEWRFDAVKQKRFPEFVEPNSRWLMKDGLFKELLKKDQPLSSRASNKLYGEMRFLVLINSAYLYAEIERQLNQVRILRSFTIAEIIFTLGFFTQLITGGKFISALTGLVGMILLIVSNVAAVDYRFHHYCRAIERSYMAIRLEKVNKSPLRK